MTHPALRSALELMRTRYGGTDSHGPRGRWRTLVRVLLQAEPPDAAFDSPGAVAGASGDVLAERLPRMPQRIQRATALKCLAEWWLKRFGDAADADWESDIAELRDELVRLRGVSLELADRLLLFVGGREAYPVDRATMRIACRHGWCEAEADYDEWQSLFVQGLRDASDRREFARLAARVGKDFCGPSPKCEACPLQSLLPPGGPYNLDGA